MGLREVKAPGVNPILRVFLAIEKRLDDGAWFRRIYVVAATVLTWQVTLWAMRFAETSDKAGVDIAAIIAAVVAAPSAVTGFAFSSYLGSRR